MDSSSGASAAFLGQTLLVIRLLVQRSHRRVAEQSLREKTDEMDRVFLQRQSRHPVHPRTPFDGYFLSA